MQENICLPCSRVDLSVLRWTSSCCFHYHFGTKLSLRCSNPRYKQFSQCNARIEQSARWARTHGEARSVFTAKLALPVARNPTHCIFATNTPPLPFLTLVPIWPVGPADKTPCSYYVTEIVPVTLIYTCAMLRGHHFQVNTVHKLFWTFPTRTEHVGNAKRVKRWYGPLVTRNWS